MQDSMGERLKTLRTKQQLSQSDVAKRIHVTPALISAYEKNERNPSISSLISLADVYRTSTDFILGRTNTNSTRTYIDVSELSEAQLKVLQDLINIMK